jgi:hypothetical protein
MRRRLVASLIAYCAVALSASAQTVTVVQSKGPGPWSKARLVEELRIGQLEGAEEYTFGNITDVAVGRDGSIFVAEVRPVVLRVFDPKGKFVKRVGRQGGGPGEYQQIDALKVMADGNIAVRDGNQGRVNILDPLGNFLRSFQLQTGFFTNDMFRVDNAGNFYAKATERTPNAPPTQLDRPMLWIKANASGAIVDTFPLPMGKAADVKLYGGPHASRVYPMVSTLSLAGGVISGSPLNYVIDVQRPGQTTLRIEREHQPLRLAGAEKDEWQAMAAYLSKQPSGRSFSTGPDGKRVVRDMPPFKYTTPEVKPAFRELRSDEEGRIWVQVYTPASKQPPPATQPPKGPPGTPPPPGADRPVSVWREFPTYDVFEASGRFLGTVVAPPRTSFMVMRGLNIWGVTRGELDEAYVVRYRIEPAK